MYSNRKIIMSLFCFILFIYGCSPIPIRTFPYEKLRLSQYDVALNDSLVFKKQHAISLETNDASLLKGIDRICLDRDTLAVFDRALNKIVIFNSEGKYIGAIHDVGSGPAEYIHVNDMCMDTKNKQIVLLCDRPYKFMYYTYSGTFVKEVNYSSFCSSFVMKDDLTYCYAGVDKDESLFYIYDNTQKIIGESRIPYAESFKPSSTTIVCLGDGNNLTSGKEAYFTRQFDNSIYVFSEDGIHPKYTIDFDKNQIPPELNRKYDSAFEFIDICDKEKYIFSITDVMENDDKLLFRTNLGLYLYDKKAKMLNGFSFINNKDLGGGVSTVMTMNDGEHLAVVYKSSVFKRMIDKNKVKKVRISGQLLDIYDSIDDESNPVLLIYHF